MPLAVGGPLSAEGRHFMSSSARAASFASEAALSALVIVTVFSQNAIPFDFSKSPFITFAAIGAQLPFSISPIVRFW